MISKTDVMKVQWVDRDRRKIVNREGNVTLDFSETV